MKLNRESIKKTDEWAKIGIGLPKFNIETMKNKTFEQPIWVHFGAGNIFRAFPALAQQKLLEKGLSDKGIIAAFPIEPEIIDNLWKPCDNLSLLVTLKANGTTEKTVIASVSEALHADERSEDWQRLIEIFKNQSLQMISFTITEKGYADLSENGVMSKISKLCYERYKENQAPIALVSMDNCSENGTVLKEAVCKAAKNNGFSADFINYLNNPEKVGFPWSMIDKITPRPDDNVKADLLNQGFEDAETIITEKGTYASAFVNAEETEYLIVEDLFPNGRPRLDAAGIIFTDRETVMLSEKMKVCTCLNPLHTALAIFGCLLSFEKISDEMEDKDLKKMVNKLGFDEGMPAVVNPWIIDPYMFLKEVLETRLPNPFLPDTPQRIATDTSQKIPVRFGETLKVYHKRVDLSMMDLKIIPFVFAGWCRYLTGINDKGEKFTLSPDPMIDELCPLFDGFELGKEMDVHKMLEPILKREDIFGINLYETELGKKVENYFAQMAKEKNAVRSSLSKLIG